MEKQIELSQEQIEELLANPKKRKKSPNTLIMNGDIEALQALIDDGLDVNKPNIFGGVPIASAIMYSDIDIVKLLIKNGADVNIVVQDRPLLVYALKFGDIEIIKLLIESGADVNVLDNSKPLALQALMFGNNELVKLLIENGANIEFENNSSLLEQSLLFSNTEIAELCIEKGSIFPQHILVDFLKTFIILELTIDGYIFDRKNILNILDEKKKFYSDLVRLEEEFSELIQTKESNIGIFEKTKNAMYEMKNRTKNEEQNINFDDFNIHVDKSIEKQNNEISKHSQELNKLHKRLHKIRSNMTNMINKINDVQDKMTVLTIIDFIKIFIKYGGDVNYKDENDSTVLIYLAYFGYEDCVKLLIDKGADMDIIDKQSHTALSMAYKNNKLPVVKLLIESGADVNITMDNGESFYKKAKHDKNHEVLEWIENSPTYIKITHDPIELVKILSNFTIDKPIKYTTHAWDFGELKKEYGNFDGYMSAVKKQFEGMKSELEELSPNLYEKIRTFLIEETPDKEYSWCSKTDINIGWSSLKGLKEHCDSGKNPFDFKLPNPISYEVDFETITIKTFEGIINLFKQEIEIRDNFKNLENLFANQVDNLGEHFHLDLSTAKLGRQFYTDTQKFSNVLDKIFADMRTRKEYPNIKVITTELEDRSIEIKITQIDSSSSRSATELLERVNIAVDMSYIKQSLTNLCDWSIESSYEDEHFRVNFLHSNNVKDIEQLKTKPIGFTHILRFYK